MGFPDSLLARDEVIHFESRPHVKALVFPTIWLLVTIPVTSAITAWILNIFDGVTRDVLAVGVLLMSTSVLIGGFLIPLVRWLGTWVIVTDQQFLARDGFRKSGRIIVPLQRIVAVDYERSILAKLFGYGSLIIRINDGNMYIFDSVPRIQVAFEAFDGMHGSR